MPSATMAAASGTSESAGCQGPAMPGQGACRRPGQVCFFRDRPRVPPYEGLRPLLVETSKRRRARARDAKERAEKDSGFDVILPEPGKSHDKREARGHEHPSFPAGSGLPLGRSKTVVSYGFALVAAPPVNRLNAASSISSQCGSG
jgi:hypothetical protein